MYKIPQHEEAGYRYANQLPAQTLQMSQITINTN